MYLIWLNDILIFILTLDIIGNSDTVTTVTVTIQGFFYLNQLYTDAVQLLNWNYDKIKCYSGIHVTDVTEL